jgi:hypothetical protein
VWERRVMTDYPKGKLMLWPGDRYEIEERGVKLEFENANSAFLETTKKDLLIRARDAMKSGWGYGINLRDCEYCEFFLHLNKCTWIKVILRAETGV